MFDQTYKPEPSSEELAYDVHFWIGANSTQVLCFIAVMHTYIQKYIHTDI